MIRKTGEFVVNLTTEKLARAADWCGVRSGKDIDKWKAMHLTKGKASKLSYAPLIEESLGSHHMFLARVLAVQVDEAYMKKNGKFELNETGLIAYSHGEYFSLGKDLGRFGWSVKKK